MEEEEVLKELSDAVVSCDPVRSHDAAMKALEIGMDPVAAINDGLVVGMGIIGENYANHTMYLPQVLVAAHSMYEGLDVLLPAIPKGDLKNSKTAITAVVQGDVHDIGKNIVKTMLTAGGLIVHDLGKDVPPETIAGTAKDEGADVVCLSTLMTPTMDSMAAAVRMIGENGYRDSCIVTIGGPPTTEGFADEIGADHRDENAQACVKYVKERLEEASRHDDVMQGQGALSTEAGTARQTACSGVHDLRHHRDDGGLRGIVAGGPYRSAENGHSGLRTGRLLRTGVGQSGILPYRGGRGLRLPGQYRNEQVVPHAEGAPLPLRPHEEGVRRAGRPSGHR